jgi:DNA-directed RNA polymerase specialized sigma subunit, sigma24 homolog
MIPEPVSPAEPEEKNLTLEIMKLPAKLKEVALLCWFQGMTYSEAAETLGISFQAVGSRLNRARRRLRSVMEGSEDHEPA